VERVLRCDCGFEVRAEDEAEVVAQIQRHASEAHGMTLSWEQALELAFHVELGDAAWPRRPDR
jgi:predicted small metal-binding protein